MKSIRHGREDEVVRVMEERLQSRSNREYADALAKGKKRAAVAHPEQLRTHGKIQPAATEKN